MPLGSSVLRRAAPQFDLNLPTARSDCGNDGECGSADDMEITEINTAFFGATVTVSTWREIVTFQLTTIA